MLLLCPFLLMTAHEDRREGLIYTGGSSVSIFTDF